MVEQEFEDEPQTDSAKFLLDPEDRNVDPETQARLEALLQAAGNFSRIESQLVTHLN